MEELYTGARLDAEGVTAEFVAKLMEEFKEQRKLHKKYAYQILLRARELLREAPSLVDIRIQDGEHITVCGDVHGQVSIPGTTPSLVDIRILPL